MIDSHCHLLPGLDDGPATTEEALLLARLLHGSGVDAVVCTPHLSRQHPTSRQAVEAGVRELAPLLADDGIPLRLVGSAELSPAAAVTEPLEEIARRSIGGRYAVVEAVADTPAAFFPTVVERLAGAGLVAVLAHPERSRAVQREPDLLFEAREAGALVQLVAPSLLGRWGSGTASTAWALAEAGAADLLGSDAHGARSRRPRLAEAAAAVERRLGAEVARGLVLDGPARLLASAGVRL